MPSSRRVPKQFDVPVCFRPDPLAPSVASEWTSGSDVREVFALLEELLAPSPSPPPPDRNVCKPFCQVGLGQILDGFPPTGVLGFLPTAPEGEVGTGLE